MRGAIETAKKRRRPKQGEKLAPKQTTAAAAKEDRPAAARRWGCSRQKLAAVRP